VAVVAVKRRHSQAAPVVAVTALKLAELDRAAEREAKEREVAAAAAKREASAAAFAVASAGSPKIGSRRSRPPHGPSGAGAGAGANNAPKGDVARSPRATGIAAGLPGGGGGPAPPPSRDVLDALAIQKRLDALRTNKIKKGKSRQSAVKAARGLKGVQRRLTQKARGAGVELGGGPSSSRSRLASAGASGTATPASIPSIGED